jgi:taurine dioxygenase
MEVRPVAPRIGAEITGVDVRWLDDAAFRVIYQAFLDHIVVVIRGQQLDEDEFLAYSARFGELRAHIVKKHHHPKNPLLMLMDNMVFDVSKGKEEKANPLLVRRGARWHTDLSFEYPSAKATQLYSRAIPSRGGDTLFANSYDAYERLPEATRRNIENLSATYCYGGRKKVGVELLEAEDMNRAPATHPLVRVHPETGRKSLYYDNGKLVEFVGIDAAEGAALAEELHRHVNVDEDYRHHWQLGDIVIWDNRCSLHSATGDAPPDERRAFWRVTIMEQGWREVGQR